MSKVIQNCHNCKYKKDCIQKIGFMDELGQIDSRFELEYCSKFSSNRTISFQSKFNKYVELKNLGETNILEIARVIDENNELFIFSIDNTLIDLEIEDLQETIKNIFFDEMCSLIKENQFEKTIEQYTIIERIKF